ncbi:MAG TPA: type II secretion system protein [Candidatus Krumholzibacteria bacterium]|nr:type II secretion system protein [Candidatus Krumholzibacteria bacterium]
MKTKGFTVIELMIVVVTIGVLVAITLPNFVRMQANAKEAGVKSNSHAVQVAAEDFSVQNDGVYATNLAAVIPTGESIIDMLPQDQRLINPFTRARTEPIDGPATVAGETGYEPVVDALGQNVGYVITGQGKTGQIVRFSNGM